MRLYLVQHGEARPKQEDPERSLTANGEADVARLAALVESAGIRCEGVIHSGKLRARQTAEILARVMCPDAVPEHSDIINPNDDPSSFAAGIHMRSGDLLVVGHLPFMARLVSLLLLGDPDQPVTGYRPGSMVSLEHDEASGWTVAWMIRPELLR